MTQSEFENFHNLPTRLRKFLVLQPDTQTYQFVVETVCDESFSRTQDRSLFSAPAPLMVINPKVYWRKKGEE